MFTSGGLHTLLQSICQCESPGVYEPSYDYSVTVGTKCARAQLQRSEDYAQEAAE